MYGGFPEPILDIMLKILTKVAVIIAISIFCLLGRPLIAETPTLTSEEIYQQKMNHWIDRLIDAESEYDSRADIIDTNGLHSRGCLMFQDATLKEYSSRYKIKGSAFNCEFEKKLTKMMIEENWNNWKQWWTSVKKKGVGYPPKKGV